MDKGEPFMIQYLLTPPDCLSQSRSWKLPMAHMAFQLGPEGRLRQAALPEGKLGGLMLLGLPEEPAEGTDPRLGVRDILAACQARDFRGVVLDLEGPPTPYRASLIPALDEALARSRRGLFLPEPYANYSARAFLYLSSALSGGSLSRRLETAAEQYGADRLVLSLHRAREDFFLPATQGAGKPISQGELERRMAQLEPRVFFSQELCAHYFTYMSRETGAHFILFDDKTSLRKKREIAQKRGIQRFFWLYPEVAEYGAEVTA